MCRILSAGRHRETRQSWEFTELTTALKAQSLVTSIVAHTCSVGYFTLVVQAAGSSQSLAPSSVGEDLGSGARVRMEAVWERK